MMLLVGVSSIQAKVYRPNDNYFEPSAPIGRDGRVVDTPEVAAAKAAHLAAFSRLASQPGPYIDHPAASSSAPIYDGYSNPSFFTSRIEHGPYGYQGPPAPLANDVSLYIVIYLQFLIFFLPKFHFLLSWQLGLYEN